MSDLHFRVATEGDAPRLQELIEAAFRFTDAHIDWVGSPELAETFNIDISVIIDRITSNDSKFLVASDTPNGPIIGCVNVMRKAPDYGQDGRADVREIGKVSQHPDACLETTPS
ncbi:hypothetical protein Forpi1262_v004895 [Fusarium oxysporum f. sp. raphani]|uniref:Uncharacterized protein n=1 Tax=Fusarium oxysporum f. sp. raphani TaxID=96318 RepID=A0A8J5Q6J3_FUSOX|nr:hypothetical protein Forpi1262_v004895 [Fusarium oxysporum f. sp. raphani]